MLRRSLGSGRRRISPASSSRSRRFVIAPLDSSAWTARKPGERRYESLEWRRSPRTFHSPHVSDRSVSVSSIIRLIRRLKPLIRSTMPSTARSRWGSSLRIDSRKWSTWSFWVSLVRAMDSLFQIKCLDVKRYHCYSFDIERFGIEGIGGRENVRARRSHSQDARSGPHRLAGRVALSARCHGVAGADQAPVEDVRPQATAVGQPRLDVLSEQLREISARLAEAHAAEHDAADLEIASEQMVERHAAGHDVPTRLGR